MGTAASPVTDRVGGSPDRAAALIDALAAQQRVLARAQARQAELMVEFAAVRQAADARRIGDLADQGGDARYEAGEFACIEIALAVRVNRHSVRSVMAVARRLQAETPDAYDAWLAGEIDQPRAVKINHALLRLTKDSSKQLLNATVVDVAVCKTVELLGRWLNRFVATVEPDETDERLRRSLEDRYVSVRPDLDGMSYLSAAVSSVDAAAVDQVLTALAAAAAPGDPRTLQQRRADALIDVLLGRVSNGCHVSWVDDVDHDGSTNGADHSDDGHAEPAECAGDTGCGTGDDSDFRDSDVGSGDAVDGIGGGGGGGGGVGGGDGGDCRTGECVSRGGGDCRSEDCRTGQCNGRGGGGDCGTEDCRTGDCDGGDAAGGGADSADGASPGCVAEAGDPDRGDPDGSGCTGGGNSAGTTASAGPDDPDEDWHQPASVFRPDPRLVQSTTGPDAPPMAESAGGPDPTGGPIESERPDTGGGRVVVTPCPGNHQTNPVPAVIGVIVSAQSLFGFSNSPGQLMDRSALVPADTIRALAQQPGTLFHRLLTDEKGRLLDVTELGRFPSRKLGLAVRFRDGVCIGPACHTTANRCDLDHFNRFPPVPPPGPTSDQNADRNTARRPTPDIT
jgi:hypothetical protein